MKLTIARIVGERHSDIIGPFLLCFTSEAIRDGKFVRSQPLCITDKSLWDKVEEGMEIVDK